MDWSRSYPEWRPSMTTSKKLQLASPALQEANFVLTMLKCWTAVITNTGAASLFGMFLAKLAHQTPVQRGSEFLLHFWKTISVPVIHRRTSPPSMAPTWKILTRLTNFSWTTIPSISSRLTFPKVTSPVISLRDTLFCPASFGPVSTIPNSLVPLAFRNWRDMWFRENTSSVYSNSILQYV